MGIDHESGATDEYPGLAVRGDEGDVAADYAARHNAESIERVLAEARRPPCPGSEHCEDCGADIPLERREAEPGATLCVECKTVRERLKGGM